MKDNRQILTSILKTAQMGQVGIESVLDDASDPGLRTALRDQEQEYGKIEEEANALAADRGWQLSGLSSSARFLADRMSRMKLMGYRSDSRIADMMIQGNTQGLIKSLRDFHRLPHPEDEIAALNQKLLQWEHDNIRQMEPYL